MSYILILILHTYYILTDNVELYYYYSNINSFEFYIMLRICGKSDSLTPVIW